MVTESIWKRKNTTSTNTEPSPKHPATHEHSEECEQHMINDDDLTSTANESNGMVDPLSINFNEAVKLLQEHEHGDFVNTIFYVIINGDLHLNNICFLLLVNECVTQLYNALKCTFISLVLNKTIKTYTTFLYN